MNLAFSKILESINQGKKQLAVLIDPDKLNNEDEVIRLVKNIDNSSASHIFIGGSLITNGFFDTTVKLAKANSSKPVIIFPGSPFQISGEADAILLLSLISGRNPEYLIGHHVMAAPRIKKLNLESIPTGYILVGSENNSSASYISNTKPIPIDKESIIVSTAIAGEMLGHKMIYLEAGSGAKIKIPVELIRHVKTSINIPLIVGGGLNSATDIKEAFEGGADLVVVGTAIEKDPKFLSEINLNR